MKPDYDIDEQWRKLEANPPVSDPEPEEIPFTPAQIEFIQQMMVDTINKLSLSVDTRESNDYYYCSENKNYRVEVSLSYKEPDGPWNGELISEASDSFTVTLPSNDSRGY